MTTTSEPVSHAAFSADGHRALIGCRYGTLIWWDIDKAAEIRKLAGSQGDVAAAAVSLDGNFALSGDGKTVRFWDLNTGAQIGSTLAPGDYVSSVAFSSDGSRGIFGTSDGSVALWQLK